jgi:hypothetical protein
VRAPAVWVTETRSSLPRAQTRELYSQYSLNAHVPISQDHGPFPLLIAKILKQHSSVGHEQYLFVDSMAVSGKGSATTRDSIRTVSELGGAAKMPLASHDRRQAGPIDLRRRSKLVNPPSPRPTESIYAKWQSEALVA